GVQALVAHLAQQQPGFGMIAADIDDIDVLLFQSRDNGVEILVALIVGLVQLLGHTGLVEGLLGLVCKTFAVSALVVEDRDVLALEVLRDVVAGDLALLIVTAADASHVRELALGEL